MINQKNFQSGSTLLLAVFILSGLTMVALAVATFTIQEIRSSRAIIVTEPAINAAETAVERALWLLKRTDSLSTVPFCTDNPTSTLHSSSNSVDLLCREYTEGTFEITHGTPRVLFLYNPDDVNGDQDLSEYPYSYVSVSNNSNSFSVEVELTRLDDTPVGVQPVLVSPNDTEQINIPAVAAGEEGRMLISLEPTAGTVSVTVTTDRGLPNNLSLVASGCSSRFTLTTCDSADQELFSRKILITFPDPN